MSTVLRVAVVIPRYNPIFGGAENQAALLNGRLIRDHAVEIPFVVTKRLSRMLDRRELVGTIPVRRIGVAGIGRWSDYAFFAVLALFLFRARRQYDLVHCHGSSLIGFTVTVVGRLLGKPVVVKLSTPGELASRPAANAPAAERWVLSLRTWVASFTRRHGHLVALNRAGAAEVLAAGARGDYSVISNGVDTVRFRPPLPEEYPRARAELGLPGTATVLLYTGRFVRRKGIDTLLKAFTTVRGEGRGDLHLLLAGSGNLQTDAAAAVVREHAAAPQSGVTAVEVEDVLPALHAADAFVFPSLTEGLSNAVLEAMAVGLPCLLSDIPPHAELRETNPNAVVALFRADSVPDLVRALREFRPAANTEVRSHMRRTGLSPEYDIDRVAARYADLYRRLISAG